MATAKNLFEAGKLQLAIEQLIREVKTNPTDLQLRTFLFELFCFSGDWERAEKQLDVLGVRDVKSEIGVQVYRNLIAAEQARYRLFTEGLKPHFLIPPPQHIDLLFNALNRLREGNMGEARAILDKAEEERPAVSGKLGDVVFRDFREYDDLIASVLEVFIRDEYYWIPFEQIKRIEIAEPKELRDLLWIGASVEIRGGVIGEVFIPTLYSGSFEHSSDMVKLGRMTEWSELCEDLFVPSGLRQFLVDWQDKAILEMRNIEFDPVVAEEELASSVTAGRQGDGRE